MGGSAAGTRWLSEGKVDTKLRQRPSRIGESMCVGGADPKKSDLDKDRETFVLQQRP